MFDLSRFKLKANFSAKYICQIWYDHATTVFVQIVDENELKFMSENIFLTLIKQIFLELKIFYYTNHFK